MGETEGSGRECTTGFGLIRVVENYGRIGFFFGWDVHERRGDR
jgi:hypothetical protein